MIRNSVIARWLFTLCIAALALAASAAVGRAEGSEEEEHAEGAGVGISAEAAERHGITFPAAGPETIRLTLPLAGSLIPHEDRVAEITPRFPGVVREVRKRLGDPVAAGEAVAIVEGNQSLQQYEVRSGLAGVVVRRDVTVGEFAAESKPLFEVADYSELYANLAVFPGSFDQVRLNQPVVLRFPEPGWEVATAITFLSPVTDPATQARFARATVPNAGGRYQPGMFVTGEVLLSEVRVPVAVATSAVRMRNGEPVLFVREGERIEPRVVRAGRRDARFVEVLDGLAAGEAYAAGNTFVLLAELEKGEGGDDD